jgi:hypothetical protein
MEYGTGALNIDGCRVGTEGGSKAAPGSEPGYLNNVYGRGMGGNPKGDTFEAGRWPANLILSHHPECRMVGNRASKDIAIKTVSTGQVVSENVAMSGPNYGRVVVGTTHRPDEEVWECHHDCPTQSFPQSKSSSAVMQLPLTPEDSIGGVHGNKGRSTLRGFDDNGSAARFFYTAKADSDDRPHGKGATVHPTVKPLDLMRYLVRLVCAPGGTVLDPFMGSGSTGCSAILEGMRFVGIEQSQEYADLAVGRLRLALAERMVEDTPAAPGRSMAVQVESTPLPLRKLRGA